MKEKLGIIEKNTFGWMLLTATSFKRSTSRMLCRCVARFPGLYIVIAVYYITLAKNPMAATNPNMFKLFAADGRTL